VKEKNNLIILNLIDRHMQIGWIVDQEIKPTELLQLGGTGPKEMNLTKEKKMKIK
jgi:hypothetical protein